jgi:hypothetical protein
LGFFLAFPSERLWGVPTLIRNLVLCATFVALAVALGFALVQVPNVELISLVVFFSGYSLGSRRGLLVGFLSMGLFTTFNPMGVPVVPVAMAQIGSMAAIGLAGGLFRGWICAKLSWIKLALIGLACTFFYDLCTNVAMAISLGLISKLFSVLAAGLVFSILHMVSNLLIFATVGPFLAIIAPHVRFGQAH